MPFFSTRRAVALLFFVAATAVPPAAQALPAPLEPLSWLTGSWACAAAGSSPVAYIQKYTVVSGGTAIAQNYTLLGTPFSGSIRYDGTKLVYASTTKAQGTVVTQHMTAAPSSAAHGSFDFTGTVSAGNRTEKERWTGTRSGMAAYIDRAYASVNGSWRTILEVRCRRT